ncbi:MAG: hypothetical protein U0992_15695 [Planctomycetaceae bacterium]
MLNYYLLGIAIAGILYAIARYLRRTNQLLESIDRRLAGRQS